MTRQKRFTKEFEDEAVRLASTSGRTRCSIAAHRAGGLRQRIPFHNQLTNQGMQPVYVRRSSNLCRFGLSGEGRCQPFDRLALPGRNHRLVDCMLGRQFRQRLIAPDRLCHVREHDLDEL